MCRVVFWSVLNGGTMNNEELVVILVTAMITLLGHIVIAIVNHKLAIVRDKRREMLTDKSEEGIHDIIHIIDHDHGK